MFSEMIQNMLNSGGRSAAMKRASQINNYVNYTNRTQTPSITKNIDAIYPPSSNNVESFEKILSNTKQTNFGSLLLNPSSLNVNANIYGNKVENIDDLNSENVINSTLLRALKEVEEAKQDFSKPSGINNKAQLLDMINKVAQKNGVDEKLVQALIKQESGFNPNAKSYAVIPSNTSLNKIGRTILLGSNKNTFETSSGSFPCTLDISNPSSS